MMVSSKTGWYTAKLQCELACFNDCRWWKCINHWNAKTPRVTFGLVVNLTGDFCTYTVEIHPVNIKIVAFADDCILIVVAKGKEQVER